ncbi:MAG: hypothetical protein ACI9YO_002087, partial [Gammaproteobacteria bacterium]
FFDETLLTKIGYLFWAVYNFQIRVIGQLGRIIKVVCY